jgi:CDP-6-deoxy-D-xylo-4-hexulose-3-dehydrase
MKWPLMHNNIVESDMDVLVKFLSQRPIPILTNGKKVREFEEEWSKWLGVKYSVFVNSGSSANILTLLALKELFGDGEVITSPLGWVSDVAAIMHAGMKPVFCDIKLKNLAIDEEELRKKITPNTRAILLTHILGYNGLSKELLDICDRANILVIEDVCESHGATFKGKKLGSFGHVSNFSFYYAHHMTSVEGGMICTDSGAIYNMARSLRSHAMAREMDDENMKSHIVAENPELNKDFIFISAAYNMRSTEMNAVIALNQLKRLDENNRKRKENLDIFLDNLSPDKYYVGFDREGNSNYAFTLLLKEANLAQRDKVEQTLRESEIEFRRGMSGGGNQLCQPYLRRIYGDEYLKYPVCNFVHHYGWYIGNYPELEQGKILELCQILNNI